MFLETPARFYTGLHQMFFKNNHNLVAMYFQVENLFTA